MSGYDKQLLRPSRHHHPGSGGQRWRHWWEGCILRRWTTVSPRLRRRAAASRLLWQRGGLSLRLRARGCGRRLVMGAPGPDGAMLFRPNEAITRVQLAQILARMARQLKGYRAEDTTCGAGRHGHGPATTEAAAAESNRRSSTCPDYAVADVSLVASLGLMSGYTGGEFRPWQGALRAQVAVAMSRYLALPAAPPAD